MIFICRHHGILFLDFFVMFVKIFVLSICCIISLIFIVLPPAEYNTSNKPSSNALCAPRE